MRQTKLTFYQLTGVAFLYLPLLLCDYHSVMIRFKLQERMAEFAFARGRRVTMDEVALATGIHRATLSRMNKPLGANITTDNLDRLCFFLGCSLNELVEYIASEPPEPRKKSARTDEDA